MGKGPDLKTVIATATEQEKEALKAVDDAEKALLVSEAQAVSYINSKTPGIISQLKTDKRTYTQFTDEFNLSALDGIIDDVVEIAKDSVVDETAPNPETTAKLIGAAGDIIKGVLALFSTTSSMQKRVNTSFTYVPHGSRSFAIYHSCNSITVDSKGAFGGRSINVVTNLYILAEVKHNDQISYEEILTNYWNTLQALIAKYNAARLNADSKEADDSYKFRLGQISDIENSIKNLGKDLGVKVGN